VVTVFRSSRADLAVGARFVLEAGSGAVSGGGAWLQATFQQEAEHALANAPAAYSALHSSDRGEVEVLVERLEPPPHLFAFGAGHDVVPLVRLTQQLGWTVSVWDALRRHDTRERFSMADHYLTGSLAGAVARLERCVSPAAVIMGHHLAQDTAVLSALLTCDVHLPYLGALGPRRRTEQMLADIRAAGLMPSAQALAALHAPVGLQLGAQTPAEVALSIVAEAQATLARVRVASLSAQSGPIHPASDASGPLMAAETRR
jgi:xanthine dehydrogenase accessory factor